MESFVAEALESVKIKRLSIEDIVRRKDRGLDCPRCWKPMRYRPVQGRMAKWSPGPYAWRCPACSVIVLDESIDPNEVTAERRVREEDKKRMASYLSSVLRGHKKSGPEN